MIVFGRFDNPFGPLDSQYSVLANRIAANKVLEGEEVRASLTDVCVRKVDMERGQVYFCDLKDHSVRVHRRFGKPAPNARPVLNRLRTLELRGLDVPEEGYYDLVYCLIKNGITTTIEVDQETQVLRIPDRPVPPRGLWQTMFDRSIGEVRVPPLSDEDRRRIEDYWRRTAGEIEVQDRFFTPEGLNVALADALHFGASMLRVEPIRRREANIQVEEVEDTMPLVTALRAGLDRQAATTTAPAPPSRVIRPDDPDAPRIVTPYISQERAELREQHRKDLERVVALDPGRFHRTW